MELMGYGVDARLVMDPERATGTCVVMVTHKGDRTMLSDPGANAALLPEDIPQDLFGPGAHLHLSGYSLLNEGSRQAALHAMNLAQKAQMSITVDGGANSHLKRAGAEPFLEWTQGARLMFLNADEAEVLTGRDEPEQAARVLTAWYPQVIIKMGADGAMWYMNGRPEPIAVPAEPLDPELAAYDELRALVTGAAPFDIADSDEFIEGAARGLDRHVLRRLRKGEFAVQAHVDLHGLTRDEARSELENFLQRSRQAGKRCVLVVHGRGLHSKDQVPVLKDALKRWMSTARFADHVLAFATARPHDGGLGAVYVLLRRL
jgi:DNA-nicking Smr family endonuclease